MKINKNVIHGFIIFMGLFFIQTISLHAQVTIGSGESPHKDALLDLKENNLGTSSKGLLLPRVTLSSTTSPDPLSNHIEGMAVYNTVTTSDVVPGYYYNDGSKWIRLLEGDSQAMPKFFYMPSIVLPTDASDSSYDSSTEEFTVDLYTLYADQFGLSDSSSSTKNPAASSLPVVEKTALDYFITYYDNSVFTDVTLSDAGVLKYKLFSEITLSEKTFMNIVFRVK